MIGRILNWVRKHKKVVALIAVGLIVFFLWQRNQQSQNQPTLQTAKVERGNLVSTVTVSGQVATTGRMNVTTQASGLVKTVLVNNGQLVNARDTIVELELDSSSQAKQMGAWASYLAAKTSLDSAQATAFSLQSDMFTQWDSFRNLATNDTFENSDKTPNFANRTLPEFHIAEKDWLAAEAKYKNQQGVIARAQAEVNASWLSYQNLSPIVTAPTSGVVSDLILVPGMSINTPITGTSVSSVKIASITSDSPTVISFNLSEVDVLKVEPGQEASVSIDSFPNKSFRARVVGIDKSGVISSGVTNYPAIVELEKTPDSILPSMSATATITIASKNNILTIPSSALQTFGDSIRVRLMKNGQVRPVPVEIGISTDTQVEIVSGLKEGDTVVIGSVVTGTQPAQGSVSPFNTQFRFGQSAPAGRTR